MTRLIPLCLIASLAFSGSAMAQAAPVTLSNDKPVQISSDTLEVQQDKSEAIFSGNVIATQGTINMRSDKMVVHYRNASSAPAAATGDDAAKGISRIDAVGNVIFTNSTDTAKGDNAVYDVDKQTLDLTGDVLLTRDKNILKGTRMNYNLATGRSVLTAGGSAVSASGASTGNGRVHGVFVPDQKK